MASAKFFDRYQSTLSTPYTAGGGTLVVTSAGGGASALPATGDFWILVEADGSNTEEVFKVTSVSGTSLLVTGSQAGTFASNHSAGAVVRGAIMTAAAIAQLKIDAFPLSIQDEGIPVTQRVSINFVGGGVTATDDSANNRTLVTIPGGASSGAPASMTAAAFDTETTTGTLNPNARTIVYLSDALYQCLWNGSAWEYYHGGFHAFRPIFTQFAWLNQGTATAVQRGGISITAPAASGGGLRVLKRAVPATPYSLTAAFLPSLFENNANECGLIWRQSSTGALVTLRWIANSNSAFNLSKWTNVTTFASDYLTSINYPFDMMRSLVWAKLEDDGTNRKVSFSPDGINWVLFHSVSRTDYITADEIGFYVRADFATGAACSINLLSWQ